MRDPVCGKEVDPLRARAVGIWGGRTYYFCSPEHKAEFARDPAAFGEHGPREPTSRAAAPASSPATRPGESSSTDEPAPSPVAAPGSAVALGSALDATASSALDSDSELPVRGAAWKLVAVCLLALVAGVSFFVLYFRR